MNQPIARQANLKNKCTCKFWECRFKSQALKTEEALLCCMAYVDLNPVRAAMAATPEASDYTSIQERVRPSFDLAQAISEQAIQGDLLGFNSELKPLLHFDDTATNEVQSGIPWSFTAYLELVDWTGRAIRDDKRGAIDGSLPPILERLSISPKQWLVNATQFEAMHNRRFNRRPKVHNSS